MPKYKKKYKAKTTLEITKQKIEAPKTKTESVKKTNIVLNINKVTAFIIFTFSIIISSYLINEKTNSFDDFIPVSDELNIIDYVQNYAPSHSFLKTVFQMYDNIHLYVKQYTYEIYLRYAVSSVLENYTENWGKWSSLTYLYLLFLITFILIIFNRNIRNITIPIAFSIILLAVSDWTSASFHYIRYYPFIVMSSMLVLIVNTYLLVYEQINIYLKSILIVVLSVLPVLFHNQGSFMMMFWVSLVSIYLVVSTIRGKNKLHYFILAIIFIISIYVIYRWLWGNIMFAITKVDFDGFYPILIKFLELSFPQTWWGVIISLILIFSPIITWKYMSKFDKTLMINSALLFLISTILSALIMGNHYSGHNGANRYFTFSHTVQLVVFALLLTGLCKFIVANINLKFDKEIIFVFLSLPLVTGIYSFTELEPQIYNFSILPQIRKSVIDTKKNKIKYIDYAVISSHTQSTKSTFPKHNVYHVKMLQKDNFIDTLSAEYLLFYNVPANTMQDDFKDLLHSKGLIINEMFVVHCDSIRPKR